MTTPGTTLEWSDEELLAAAAAGHAAAWDDEEDEGSDAQRIQSVRDVLSGAWEHITARMDAKGLNIHPRDTYARAVRDHLMPPAPPWTRLEWVESPNGSAEAGGSVPRFLAHEVQRRGEAAGVGVLHGVARSDHRRAEEDRGGAIAMSAVFTKEEIDRVCRPWQHGDMTVLAAERFECGCHIVVIRTWSGLVGASGSNESLGLVYHSREPLSITDEEVPELVRESHEEMAERIGAKHGVSR